ncbi:hypothetical protein KFL_003010060 [Klebsormidium nitens]|uniref:Uncharacterized protein n=1 Tax=Klebsormidium nitens TaxID=105231 RepID=A0A1Y1I6R0_KLENI|nr:hypothetical protein KFL_003010060 [Klebsormidium nitens]|eukprot:GAQ86630.1 hypothetical protein KFL_003010060 [Klebsormidium nitens]
MSIRVLAAPKAAALQSPLQSLICSEWRRPQASVPSNAGLRSTFKSTKRASHRSYNAANPVNALTKTAFYGKQPNIAWQSKSSSRIGRGGTGAIQASVLDGVHMEPGGLVVLEEETKLTQDEWEEAKNTVRAKKATERWIEQMIFNCRFFTLAGVAGSLLGSFLCFLKGSYYVFRALQGYIALIMIAHDKGQVVMKLIEALDTYLVGTVMLIFGMGLYELFVMKLEGPGEVEHHNSSFFGLFRLEERPTWLAINGLDDLKTKLGHVIVMILLVGMFEKSKKVHPQNSTDLFLTAGSVLMCAGSLYLLNLLKH